MIHEKCEYRTVCNKYERDAVCCTIYPIFNLCLYKRRFDRIEARLEEEKRLERLRVIDSMLEMREK